MSADAIGGIGAAAVSTIGTVAVVGVAAKTIGKATGGFRSGSTRRSGNRTRKSGTKRMSGKMHGATRKSYSIWS